MPVFKNTGEDLLLSRIESRLTSPNLSPFTAGFFGRVAIACRFPHLSSAHSNLTTSLPGPPASGCTSPPPSRALLFQPPLPLSSQHFTSTCHHPPIPTHIHKIDFIDSLNSRRHFQQHYLFKWLYFFSVYCERNINA